MKKEPIEIGKTYGHVHVDKISDRPYRCYDCTCLKCGRGFTESGHMVYSYAETGCGKCIREGKARDRADAYTGTVFGSLKVLGFSGYKPTRKDGSHRGVTVSCLCLKCGSVTDIRLARLKSGGAKVCAKCARTILSEGHELVKISNKGGTSVLQIADRATNKNNTSGHKGVSWRKKSSKWFAYISFQRKQYYLGQYDDLQDAVNARLVAEKKIYGSFLDWYAETYPDQWERLQIVMGGKNEHSSNEGDK